MKPTIRLALRDWDYITPLALGDIASDRVDLRVTRVANLPDLADSSDFDASEMSLSRYTTSRARGVDSVLGVPNFIMRGFRHRCVITRIGSPHRTLGDLKGGRIGLAGWQDSGNTWTRAALAHAGVGIADAQWIVGRLTAQDPTIDRLAGFGKPGRIDTLPGDPPIVDLLLAGDLDAVFMPFMPSQLYGRQATLRHLVTDLRTAERAYFDAVGYVPGIHVLGVKSAIAQKNPWLAQELSDTLDRSIAMWTQKRRRYMDTTAWMIEELGATSRDLPEGWDASGLHANRTMIAAFIAEAHGQGLMTTPVTPDSLFPAAP